MDDSAWAPLHTRADSPQIKHPKLVRASQVARLRVTARLSKLRPESSNPAAGTLNKLAMATRAGPDLQAFDTSEKSRFLEPLSRVPCLTGMGLTAKVFFPLGLAPYIRNQPILSPTTERNIPWQT
jgi:hypothetical protein